jgi:hypothetical protein
MSRKTPPRGVLPTHDISPFAVLSSTHVSRLDMSVPEPRGTRILALR